MTKSVTAMSAEEFRLFANRCGQSVKAEEAIAPFHVSLCYVCYDYIWIGWVIKDQDGVLLSHHSARTMYHTAAWMWNSFRLRDDIASLQTWNQDTEIMQSWENK